MPVASSCPTPSILDRLGPITTPEQAVDLRTWQIENRLHWVRDHTNREDHSRIRTSTPPRIIASLRNLAISGLRLAGHTSTTTGLRHMARNSTRPLTLHGTKS